MRRAEISVDSVPGAWRRTAKSRLRFELVGLSFACQRGFGPQDYARHLWSKGAIRWMGKGEPSAAEYLLREAQALREFYPEVSFTVIETGEEKAELVFTEGCLGSWGTNRWALARSLGLNPGDVCAYCREAFSVWASQLGLHAHMNPEQDEVCILSVVKP